MFIIEEMETSNLRVMDTCLTQSGRTLILSVLLEFVVHGCIVDLSGFTNGDSLPLPLFVEEEEEDDLTHNEADKDDEDDENSEYTGCVSRSITGFEEEGTDNISDGGGGVEKSHDDGLLGLTSGVGDNP